METIFTGIQPTTTNGPHIGNYLGAIKPTVHLIDNHTVNVMVADLHATTVDYDPIMLRDNSLMTASVLYACGIPHENVFRQSANRDINETYIYVSHLATLGPLERMTQFKDKTTNTKSNDKIPFGLLSYPLLMAADIISFNPDYVTVGIDQHQHIQLTTDIIKKLNNKIKLDAFKIPKMIQSSIPKVMNLINYEEKMSKSSSSQNGVLYLSDTLDIASKKIKKATTDSKECFSGEFLDQSVPIQNIINLISEISGKNIDDICVDLQDKKYSSLKELLINVYEEHIIPIQKNIVMYQSDKDQTLSYFKNASINSRNYTNPNVSLIRECLGIF